MRNKDEAPKLLLGAPSEKQKLFLSAAERYVAYGGARGGGKSWAVRTKAILLCLNYEGARVLILRRTLPELRENHVKPLLALLGDAAVYSEVKKTFTFPNSSTILCGYCRNEKDLMRYQGQEFDFIFIDEATQMEEYVFHALKGCLRGVGKIPKRMYLTCNPGGVGHVWVKRLFVDRKYGPGENAADFRFIPAKLSDNAILQQKDPSYLSALESLPETLRRAWLDGCWDLFEGQFFDEFDRELHVCAPFAPGEDWKRYLAFDYGLDMLACLWFAVSPDGRIYVYRELHESGLIVSQAAKKIKELSANETLSGVCLPPDMASRQKDSGLSMRELFERNGVTGVCADNRRVPGWLAVKELLRPIKDEEGNVSARLRIFSSCPVLISHLPALVHDTKDPGDASVYPHEITHICDALRYFALTFSEEDRRAREKRPLTLKEELQKKASLARRGVRKNGF